MKALGCISFGSVGHTTPFVGCCCFFTRSGAFASSLFSILGISLTFFDLRSSLKSCLLGRSLSASGRSMHSVRGQCEGYGLCPDVLVVVDFLVPIGMKEYALVFRKVFLNPPVPRFSIRFRATFCQSCLGKRFSSY